MAAKKAYLNQIIAVEHGTKPKVYSQLTELNKIIQKGDLFNGFTKHYRPLEDGAETLPGETKRIQYTVPLVKAQLESILSDLFTVVARKDYTNVVAKASVVVDDVELVKDAPISFLLFLEKQLTDIRTFIGNLPVLDQADEWNFDPNAGVYRTGEILTNRTKRTQKPIVLYPATTEHPAQTQLVPEDIIAGTWVNQKQSGAIPMTEKRRWIERVDKLIRAVKEAREQANMCEEVVPPDVATPIFNFIFADPTTA